MVYPIASRYISGTVLVEDGAILGAQKTIWSVLRIVAEPGGAAAMAALLSGRYVREKNERVGIIISGGNTVAVDFSG